MLLDLPHRGRPLFKQKAQHRKLPRPDALAVHLAGILA
jgi:hypothetical protein